MPMSHYIANLRDIEFCLFDLLGIEKVFGTSTFSELDRATAMGMLEEVKRMAENDLAASFIDGDRLGVQFDPATGDAKLPESFKKSYKERIKVLMDETKNVLNTIENIKEKAEVAGYTITDVARHAGFHSAQVSRYATGKTIPLVTTIRRLDESVDSLIQSRFKAIRGLLND